MSTNNPNEAPDPEDMFAETRMSFGDHIEELRWYLIRAIKGFVIGMIISIWPLGPWVLRIIVDPVETQLADFHKRKVLSDITKFEEDLAASRAKMPTYPMVMLIDKEKWDRAMANEPPVLNDMVRGFEKAAVALGARDMLREEVRNRRNLVEVEVEIQNPIALTKDIMLRQAEIRRPGLSALSITEVFFVYFKVSMLTGLILSSPWVFWQIWAFIAAGLYPHEKKLVHVYLPFSLFLFLGGVALCQFFVMSRAVGALLWFNEWLGFDADLRLSEWLGFALMMPLVFGISFQTPLVMMFAHKVGIVTVQTYRDHRRIAWFLMAIFAALITPTPDAVTMLFLWIPMGALYELGILLCVYQGESGMLAEWEEEEKANELVEV